MKSKNEYLQEREQAITKLQDLNNLVCAELARLLRLHDNYKRVCKELGEPPEVMLHDRELEAAYWMLSFGAKGDRWTLLFGTQEDRKALISGALRRRGFEREDMGWYELG